MTLCLGPSPNSETVIYHMEFSSTLPQRDLLIKSLRTLQSEMEPPCYLSSCQNYRLLTELIRCWRATHLTKNTQPLKSSPELQDPHSVLLYKPQCSSSTSMVTTSVSSRESEATTSNQSSVKLEPTESPPCSEEMGREVTQTNRRQSAVTTTEAIPLNLLSSMMAYHERQAEQQVAVNYARPYHPAVQPYGRITDMERRVDSNRLRDTSAPTIRPPNAAYLERLEKRKMYARERRLRIKASQTEVQKFKMRLQNRLRKRNQRAREKEAKERLLVANDQVMTTVSLNSSFASLIQSDFPRQKQESISPASVNESLNRSVDLVPTIVDTTELSSPVFPGQNH